MSGPGGGKQKFTGAGQRGKGKEWGRTKQQPEARKTARLRGVKGRRGDRRKRWRGLNCTGRCKGSEEHKVGEQAGRRHEIFAKKETLGEPGMKKSPLKTKGT